MLRRERVIATIWIIILVLFSVALAPGMEEMFIDQAARDQVIAIYDNPIMVSMMGPVYGNTTGAMYSAMMLLWYMLAVAIMNIFLVVRHTRADEEHGRTEVVRSLPVGKLANINAVMITALIINTILAIATGLGMAVTQVETMGFAGCMLYGITSGATGLVFAAITAVFCQLSQSSGGAVGLSFLTVGGAYMLRAMGDIDKSVEFLSLISPLGLPLRTKIFTADESWLPVLILLLEVVIISALAYKLNSMRDLGQGFIPAKPGKKEAAKSMLSPFGLSFRLLRKMLIIWLITMFCAGASYGTVIGDIGSYVSNMPAYLEMVGLPPEVIEALSDEQMEEIAEEYADMITEYFGVFITGMMTLISLIPVLLVVLRLRSEERDGRVEHVISRAVSRGKYFCGYITIAYVLSVFTQLFTAVGLYAVAATAEKNPFTIDGLIIAYMSYLPAIWVMLGFAVLLIGIFPKATGVLWGYYGFVCFVMFLGSMPDLLPKWLTSLSPMKHIPQIPLEEMNWVPIIILTIIALALTTIGFFGYKQRDMVT